MDQGQARATEEMMAVPRTLTAIVARILNDVADEITVPQLRLLVLLNSRGAMNLSTIASISTAIHRTPAAPVTSWSPAGKPYAKHTIWTDEAPCSD
jgi:hypothetical protein